MFQFTFTTLEAPGDFSEGMGAAQMTEEHGDELTPAGESSGMAFGASLFDGLLKFMSWVLS